MFERRWAFAVLERTMAELQRECSACDRGDLFQELQGFLPGGSRGCGVVYMAEQEQLARRKVALKVIKVGMDTR